VIYTAHDGDNNNLETQCLAFSTDAGQTWKKYKGNPVIDCKYPGKQRDPKVFWYGPGKRWVMCLFENGGIAFYSSQDLKNWNWLSRVEGYHECPDMFELEVDAEESNKKWVLLGGDASAGSPLTNTVTLVINGVDVAQGTDPDSGGLLVRNGTTGGSPAPLQRVLTTGDLGGYSFGAEKSSTETTISDTTLSDDAELSYFLPPGIYFHRLLAFFSANVDGSMGIQWRLNFTGSFARSRFSVASRINGVDVGGATPIFLNSTQTEATITTVGASDYIDISGIFVVTVGGTLSFQWAQNSSVAQNLAINNSSSLTSQKITE